VESLWPGALSASWKAIALDQGALLDAALTWKVPISFNLPVAKLILPTIQEIERSLLPSPPEGLALMFGTAVCQTYLESLGIYNSTP
jgi:hypothetical protein